MRTKSILGAVAALVLAGCGGGGGGTTERGSVSGVVFDADGHPVRDVLVYVADGGRRETRTDSAGAYVLDGVAAEDLPVYARTTADGQTFVGENLARVFGDERERSVNITLVAESSQARIVGLVTTSNGRLAKGLRVVARPTDGVTLSSSSALTDSNGNYSIDGLIRGVEYRLLASANGRGQDSRVITPSARETQQNLVLGTASHPNLPAPANLDAVAYTTPGDPLSRSVRQAAAFEAVKQRLDPTRAARLARRKTTRDTTLGRPIEIDLFWDDYTTPDTVGYGIYRRVGSNGVDTELFLQDALASYYADGDGGLQPGTEYSYVITAISSSFEDDPQGSQSDDSNRISATPLGDMVLNAPNHATVNWALVSGATTYRVYAYDEYPGLGVVPINGTQGQATSGNSLTVTRSGGGALTAGQTYYYVVVGERADGSARTLSIVGTIIP